MIIPFPVTQNEIRILKYLKKPISLPDLKSKFHKEERSMVESLIRRLVCYGVITQERIEYRTHPKTTYSKTLYVFDNRELIVKDDETVRYERIHLIERDQLFVQFGVEVDPSVQKQIVELAGSYVPRTEIAKQMGLKKLTIIQVIIANEKEVESLRRKNARFNQENKQTSEIA